MSSSSGSSFCDSLNFSFFIYFNIIDFFQQKNIDPSFFYTRSKLNRNKTIAKSEISQRKKRSLNTECSPFAKKNLKFENKQKSICNIWRTARICTRDSSVRLYNITQKTQ